MEKNAAPVAQAGTTEKGSNRHTATRPSTSDRSSRRASSAIRIAISGATLSAMALPGPYCSEPIAFS